MQPRSAHQRAVQHHGGRRRRGDPRYRHRGRDRLLSAALRAQPLLGTASFGKVRYFRSPSRRHTADSEFSVDSATRLPRVDILYAHAGIAPDLVGSSVSHGARGIVVAGVGNGNVPAGVVRALAEAAQSGVVVVRSTRVGSGEVARGIEVDDDALGFVAADQLNPQKSRVLLQLCLAHGMDRAAVQEAFYRY